jgi:hypothetical protein
MSLNWRTSWEPQHVHRRKAAERAIWTFKNHFIAGLCSADYDFPIRLWDKLLPQAETTLNLMRASRADSSKSAYKATFGPFNHNHTPLAPPGCKVLIHEKPDQGRSWDPHQVKGWYLGPAVEHYCCHQCYVTNTQAERISDTVEPFPKQAPTPTLTSTEVAIIAAEALIKALNNPSFSPHVKNLRDTAETALQELSKAYKMNQEPASPRVEEAPRGVPALRVPAAKWVGEHPELLMRQKPYFIINVGPTPLLTQSQGQQWSIGNSSATQQPKKHGNSWQPTNFAVSRRVLADT